MNQKKIILGHEIYSKIGFGSFGSIYKALNLKNNELIALKKKKSNNFDINFDFEAQILKYFHNSIGFPEFRFYTRYHNNLFLGMELLGPNLSFLFKKLNNKFGLKTVLMIADQILLLIERIHKKKILHGDIKPENFIIGKKSKLNIIHIIDFGLSIGYTDNFSEKHVEITENNPLRGTTRYLSINGHKGLTLSRKDELESIGYLLIYFLKGSLPWQNLTSSTTHSKIQLIFEKKLNTSIQELCLDLPSEFVDYFNAVKSLEFSEKPNYSYYRQIFRNLFINKGFIYDYQYDWLSLPKYELIIHKLPFTHIEKRSNQKKFDLLFLNKM